MHGKPKGTAVVGGLRDFFCEIRGAVVGAENDCREKVSDISGFVFSEEPANRSNERSIASRSNARTSGNQSKKPCKNVAEYHSSRSNHLLGIYNGGSLI